jgi:hypothetical protein
VSEFTEAIKELLYPLTAKDKQGTEAWDSLSLAVYKDYKGAGELFIKNFAKILAEGEEINDLIIKDLDYFERLFSFNSFPELVEALQGKQELVEVYDSKIPAEGTSFPSKTPFLSKSLIKERIGNTYG